MVSNRPKWTLTEMPMSSHEPKVHVLAPPDDTPGADERLCTDTDEGQTVIFHAETETSPFGHFRCQRCGVTNGPKS